MKASPTAVSQGLHAGIELDRKQLANWLFMSQPPSLLWSKKEVALVKLITEFQNPAFAKTGFFVYLQWYCFVGMVVDSYLKLRCCSFVPLQLGEL